MSHIFISYSRKDLDFAQRIVDALAAQGLDTWIDWKSIPKTVDWEEEIYRGIEEADAFLFMISTDSVQSEMCNNEISHAVANGKRIIPIVIHDVDAKTVPTSIKKLNWIFCREKQDDFTSAVEQIREAIHTDYEWLKFHTKLQIKALEWERRKDASRLFRGKELLEVEHKLAMAGSQKDPQPTSLQRQFVLASHKEADRRFRLFIAGVTFGAMAIIITLAISNIQITQQRNRARANELATLALNQIADSFDRSLLFGVEAMQLSNNYRTRSVMLSLLQANPRLIQLLYKHTGAVTNVAFSPDGRMLASAGENVILWNITDLTSSIQPYSQITDSALGVAISPDGKILATDGGDIILWNIRDPSSPARISTLVPKSSGSWKSIGSWVLFSPNGKILASWGYDPYITLSDVSNPTAPIQISTIYGNSDFLSSLAFSPDGKILASADQNNNTILWDITNPATPVNLTSIIGWLVAFSPDGNTVATASRDDTVILWDISVPHHPIKINTFVAHTGFPVDIGFSSDGKNLVVVGQVTTIWDISNFTSPKQINSFVTPVSAIPFFAHTLSSDLRTLASGNKNGSITLWNLSDPAPSIQISTLTGHTYIDSLAFSMDGKTLASGSEDNNILLWDISNQKNPFLISSLSKHAKIVWTSTKFSPDRKTLISTTGDNTIILWDISAPITPIPIATLTGRQFALSPDGNTLITAGEGDVIVIWDVSDPVNPLRVGNFASSKNPLQLVFSPDGKILAIVGWGSTTFWDITNHSTPKQISTFNGWYVAFSSDERVLASVVGGSVVYLWNVSNPVSPIKVGIINLAEYTNLISSVAFSPDGKTLATAIRGNFILWDVSDPAVPIQLGILPGSDFAFSPNGEMIASDVGNNIFLWDLDPLSWLKKACQIAGRNFTQTEWTQYFPQEPYHITCPQWPAGE